MFAITAGKGFAVTFDNGVTVSVQFGGGNYCSRRDESIGAEREMDYVTSHDAEIAIVGPGVGRERPWLTKAFDPSQVDDVMGWVSPERVLEALAWAAAYAPTESGLAPALSPQ